MSKLRSYKRHLNPSKVWFAASVAEEKIKIARQVVLDRVKKDVEFASDVLKAVGENLPKEIREACETTIDASKVDELGLSQEKCNHIDKDMGLVANEKFA